MVSFGCIAKVLRGLECKTNVWIKTVNPGWYEAREFPKAIFTEKVFQKTSTKSHEKHDEPNTAESAQKVGTPMRQPYF
ncbi:uncharacterized protein LOC110178537 [Drosophila serrata]|uniref:uncharacterized protein LOC110178537 n=1 Tax=Drosophila serrata TaxID=7274 RepID=UPI000A1D30CB|nr:uncharacterized protein LOC110178537 [Drosophila serrata]